MADKKISDFTAVTSVADADLFEIETAAGNSRKITKANLFAFSGALVKKSADQTSADYSAFPTVSWDAEEYDTDAYHDNSTNPSRLTVPAAGYYVVSGELSVGSGTLTVSEYIRLSINRRNSAGTLQSLIGLPQNDITEISASPTISVLGNSMPILCSAGDYFEISFDTEADTSITIQATTSWFGIYRVA